MSGILAAHVSSGLCNRLRALYSAAHVAEKTNRRLIISWPVLSSFPARFSDLWEHPWSEPAALARPRVWSGIAKAGSAFHIRHDEKTIATAASASGRICLVDTVHAYAQDDELRTQVERTKPVAAIRDVVDQFSQEYFTGHSVVGVTVRSVNAHQKTAEASPPQWFVDRMNQIAKNHDGVKFFLSADSREVSELLRSKVHAEILELPKSSTFNSADGLRDAVCDLYLLGRTGYILGSYWSSFSRMAGLMQPRFAVENSVNGYSEDALAKTLQPA